MIKFWDLTNLKEIENSQENQSIQFSRVEFFPHSKHLLGVQKIAGVSNVYIWEQNELKIVDYTKNIEGYIRETCFSQNGIVWAATL